jgi:6-pyruvoyltetrahydropterin/6-carboxytetrahydropterin synthase
VTSYHVRIAKDHLVFSAGHFITVNGDVCERLHGHNYRVAAEVAGPHPLIRVETDEREVLVTFRDRRWIFPRGDCLILPVANTTTELLARYIGLELLDRLETRLGARPQTVRIEVDECFGQLAVCELRGE